MWALLCVSVLGEEKKRSNAKHGKEEKKKEQESKH